MRTHYRLGPRVVRIIETIKPASVGRYADQKQFAASIFRDGCKRSGMSRWTKPATIENFRSKRDDRDSRICVISYLRPAALKALKRVRHSLPAVAPKRLVRVNVRKQSLNFR